MSLTKSTRIESIDILRGVVMVIMALDHSRDYFHLSNSVLVAAISPTDMATTTPFLFFTRFITHYCAPVFVFLAGTSSFLYGSKKTKAELSKFLFTRGVWLIVLEFVVNNFVWQFDLGYNLIVLQVIWAIGISMVCLSALIYLPKKALLLVGIILVAGHNLLDGIVMQGNSFQSIVWYILHQRQPILLESGQALRFSYPIIPWVGVIVLGYCFGTFYQRDYNPPLRKKWLLRLGLGAIALFFIIRGINVYGNLEPWAIQKNNIFTVMSFFNVTKYPPSLSFVLITLGPAMLFLYGIENIKNKITDFFLVFGRVPLFYYFLHIFVIHLFAILAILILDGDWYSLVTTERGLSAQMLSKYGHSLLVVYLVWIGVLIFLYPFCKKYMIYKANNKDKWWLSYL